MVHDVYFDRHLGAVATYSGDFYIVLVDMGDVV